MRFHRTGAISAASHALEACPAEIDVNEEIIAYCHGPYCVLSYEAVAALQARGYTVWRLEDGLTEWRAAGLSVEAGLQR